MVVDPEDEDEAGRDLAKVVVEQSLSARAEKEDLKAAIRQLDQVLDRPDLAVSKWPRTVEECLNRSAQLRQQGVQVRACPLDRSNLGHKITGFERSGNCCRQAVQSVESRPDSFQPASEAIGAAP